MKVIVHRGTHQIGGTATEISTRTTRIVIDMGDELSLDPNFQSTPLQIPGVTDGNGQCAGVLFTHIHADHIGQYAFVREDTPLFMGKLSRDVWLLADRTATSQQKKRIQDARTFCHEVRFLIGDIGITPLLADHSFPDSYMFLIEAEGKRILHTGDFRAHGLRGGELGPALDNRVGKLDALIIEGTTLSRAPGPAMTEEELVQKVRQYINEFKYVFVLSATTHLERAIGFSRAVPRGKYFICDEYQKRLLALASEANVGSPTPGEKLKITTFGDNLQDKFKKRGFLMMVRVNSCFRRIMSKFDPKQSVILYSLWDGYRTRPGSPIPNFLSFCKWERLHTGGHATLDDILMVIGKTDPAVIIPIHTDSPDALRDACPGRNVALPRDGEVITIT